MNSKEELTLVINLSLSTVKAIIFNEKGEKIYHDWLPVRTFINGATVEQDPEEWWMQTIELLKKIFISEYGNKIKYLSVTSSALCLVMVDYKGAVIDRSYMVSDKRAHKEAELLQEKFKTFFDTHKSFKSTASFMLPKILWIKRNKRSQFMRTAIFMSSNDYLIYKLTGEFITDDLNAEKFFYDTNAREYPKEILEFIGITTKQLPVVVSPGEQIVRISKKMSKLLHIKQQLFLVVGTYDAICSLIGSSTFDDGELNNVCGTCSSYRVLRSVSLQNNTSCLLEQKFHSENFFITGGSNNLEGGVLEWAKSCFYGESFAKDNALLYELIEKEASESNVGSNGLVFIPYLIGERLPFEDPDVRGMYFGIERFHTRHDMIRSVFEAMAYQARLMLEEFEKSGIEISSVNMSGGGAKIKFAAQLRSHVLGLPIKVLSEVETTALGAFILTQKARRKIKSIREGKRMVKVDVVYMPNMHYHNSYSSLYILYKQLYEANSMLFKKRKEILDKMSLYHKNVLENL